MNDNGYEISFKHELVKLVTDDSGRVTGAIFKTDGGYTQINARKGVLLATGGYSANPAMLSALSPITTASVTALGYNQNNTGDGIKAALWAGAVKDITSATMIFDRGLVAPGTTAGYTQESIEAGNPQWPGNGQFNPGTQPFLKVNLRGERFTLESADYDYLPHAAAQQPGGVYVSVWDGNFGDDVQRFHTLGCSAGTRNGVLAFKNEDGSYDLDGYFEKELADGRLQKADTLEELADKLGFDAEAKETFLATCERYNELYDMQQDVDFGKEAYRLSELRTPAVLRCHVGRHAAHHHRRRAHQRRLPGAWHGLRAHRRPVLRRRLLGVAVQRQLSRSDARRGVRPHDDRSAARGEAFGERVRSRCPGRAVKAAHPGRFAGAHGARGARVRGAWGGCGVRGRGRLRARPQTGRFRVGVRRAGAGACACVAPAGAWRTGRAHGRCRALAFGIG